MTTTSEEIRALEYGYDFLKAIVSGEYKRCPKELRWMANKIWRHYPGPTRIKMKWALDDYVGDQK